MTKQELRSLIREEIRKVFKYPKKLAQLEMGMISLNFGLKFSDFSYSEEV